MADIDWTTWGKTRPFTLDALSQFNALDIDPFTAQVGCTICQQFKFSTHGDQNIAHAFGGLPRPQGFRAMGFGYTPRHVVPLLLRSDEGSTFLAICGALSEYYSQEMVVSIFMAFARRSKVPPDVAPAESQWNGLVAACAGVLATSTFGTTVTEYAALCEASISTSPADVVEGLLALNNRATRSLSGDGPFLAAVAEWLFGLGFAIETEKHRVGSQEGQEQLVIHSTPSKLPTAGRVAWNSIFHTSFGQAWVDLDKDTLISVIASASAMTHNALLAQNRDPRTFFLHQESGLPRLAGHGMNETIVAWFEELRRLAPGISRFYKTFHDHDDNHREFEKRMQALESNCKCSACGDGSSDICKVSLVELIVALGLFVARMVVVPNLYPKVNGVQEAYKLHHQNRLNRQKEHDGYSKWFIEGLIDDLPTPFRMLEVACVLFTGNLPERMSDQCVSFSRSGLYLMQTYLKFNPDDAPETRPAASVQVQNGGFSYQGRFLTSTFWDLGVAGLSIDEGFELFRTVPKEVKRVVKLRDQTMLVSLIRLNQGQEAKAEAEGWDIIT